MAEVLEISDALLKPNLSREDQKRLRQQIGDRALHWWSNASDFRSERKQARDMYAGDQYNNLIRDDEGELVTEKSYIEGQNRVVVVMNMVANILNNLHGSFLTNKSERAAFAVEQADEEDVKALNLARRAMRRQSRSHIIEADNALEHFLSGLSAWRQDIKWSPTENRSFVRDYKVNPTRFFYNLDVEDRRLEGLNVIGQLHDVSRSKIYQQFARSRGDMRRLDGLMSSERGSDVLPEGTGEYGFDAADSMDFFVPADAAKHRVIEIWTPIYTWVRFGFDPLFLETQGYEEIQLPDNQIARIQNQRREAGLPLLELDDKRYEPFWHSFYMNADYELYSKPKPSPFWHGKHPYSLGFAMNFDGKTWGIVRNLISPQRLINRMFSQIDHSMGVGAKGAIGIDQDALDEAEQTLQEILDNYSRADGHIALPLRGRSWEQVIHQFQSTALQAGHFQMIPMLWQIVERISGINDAAQGLTPKAGTPGILYDRQVAQAAVNAYPYLQSYFDALREKDVMHLQLTQQAISERRTFPGERNQPPVEYVPDRVRQILADVSIGEIVDTNTHREQQEAMWLSLVQAGAMPLEAYLQLSSNPRALEALAVIEELGRMATDDPESNALQTSLAA